ncbi:MAG: succinylglutamate desuccinylase/aspartoacylase family protein [Terrimicrobiaceae bacterium]|nr:succinylglutamate desuccinylase/aspartoacylase family protein [Terrimicrobiaceae bacterium]
MIVKPDSSSSIHLARRLRERRSVRESIRPIEELARGSQHLFTAHLELTGHLGERVTVPRFLFAGPGSAGASFLRLGIFGGLHGDEEASVLGAVALLEHLHRDPEIARGYELVVYPVCNPTGYADDTRWSRNGVDLNRQFWRDSAEPEVILLERQLVNLAFDGIVALHSDDHSAGLYGFVKGHALTRHVLEPALARAAAVLPRNFDKSIDNFHANEGIIEAGYPGVLTAPPAQYPRPLEIVFETPQLAPIARQIEAHRLALEEILLRFRATISEAQSI